MKIIVGLGNPGVEFDKTYHNIGFMALDYISKKIDIEINRSKFNSLYGQGYYKNEQIFLIKPLTFMNLSGQAVKNFVDYYKLKPEDVFVICDDIDLPKGTCRYRENGSGGTHNGLKNIVFMLQSENFKRVKIGAAKENKLQDLKDYVLSKIDEESYLKIYGTFEEVSKKILTKIGI